MRSIFAFARQATLDVEALVLPVACLGCARAVPDESKGPLCDQCRVSLRPIASPKCARCGQTLDAWELGPDGRRQMADGRSASANRPSAIGHLPSSCGFCRKWPEALSWAVSAVWYEDTARELVRALKYGGWTVAAAPMAQIVIRCCGSRLRSADQLVPGPLGRRRLRERGYNQAAALAAALAVGAGLRAEPGALQRSRETVTQTALDPKARRDNVAGAFVVRGAPGAVRGKKVVLVDDVLTTGATLGAAAEALHAAGAAEIGAITLARAGKPA